MPHRGMTEAAAMLHREGDAHVAAGRFEDALASFRAAMRADPDNPFLYFNIGNVLRQLGRPGEAILAYDLALLKGPGFAMAHHNRAICVLQLGDLAAGFREYEWRKACPTFLGDERYTLPRSWRGEPLAGKILYIFAELFQGDLIQFGRYALVAQQLGARVILSAPVAMHALLQTMSADITLIDMEVPTPDYEFQAALMTMPLLTGTTIDTVPAAPAYLHADPQRVFTWRGRIGEPGLKVGIVWQGSVRAAQRSFPLRECVAALAQPGVRLISLQKHAGLDQLADLAPGEIEELGDDFDAGPDAFVDTAAAIACCDLVISADTSVAHLAGALGAPVWLATAQPADWRWLEDRATSPWYPSMRLFRQHSRGDWASVFADMRKALEGIRPA